VTELDEPTVELSYADAQALWNHWASDSDDVLAHAAFERTLRFAAGIEDEGLYFRPGGWIVGLPATVARVALAGVVLAGSFEVAGLHDVEREIIITAAGLADREAPGRYVVRAAGGEAWLRISLGSAPA
jgi:hypothetical protein